MGCSGLKLAQIIPIGILGNPGVTHSVPTAFIMMNAVGTEWVTPGLPRMTYRLVGAYWNWLKSQ